MRAVEALQQFCRDRNLAEKEIFGLALALEECGSNIVNHALARDPQRQFEVSIEQAGDAVSIELRDAGPEFDPTRQDRTAALEAADDDRPPGGWGIQLVRKYMDQIHYRRENGQNVLRLVKQLPPHSDSK